MRAHPAADIFPTLPDAELQQLADDIRENGLLEPIVVREGQILDGRNRWHACQVAGVEPRTVEWDGEGGTPAAYVVAKNIRRRHLTASQRAAIAAELLPELEEEARERMSEGGRGGKIATPSKAREQAASAAAVSPRYVSDAKRVRDEDPEVHRRVREGKTTIPKAKREVEVKKKVDLSFMSGWPDFRRDEALNHLEALPERDRQPAAQLVNQPGIPAMDAVPILENLSRLTPQERSAIYRLAASTDARDRSLALTRAAKRPPMPDPRVIEIGSAIRILRKCVMLSDRDGLGSAFQDVIERLVNIKARLEAQQTEDIHDAV